MTHSTNESPEQPDESEDTPDGAPTANPAYATPPPEGIPDAESS